jgi:hypothetical protein
LRFRAVSASLLLVSVLSVFGSITTQGSNVRDFTFPIVGLQASEGQTVTEQLLLEAYDWVGGTVLVLQLRNVGPVAIALGTADVFVNGISQGQVLGTCSALQPTASCIATFILTGLTLIGGVAYVLRIVTPDGLVFDYSLICGQESSAPLYQNQTTSQTGPELILEAYHWDPGSSTITGTLRYVGSSEIRISDAHLNAISMTLGYCNEVTFLPQDACSFTLNAPAGNWAKDVGYEFKLNILDVLHPPEERTCSFTLTPGKFSDTSQVLPKTNEQLVLVAYDWEGGTVLVLQLRNVGSAAIGVPTADVFVNGIAQGQVLSGCSVLRSQDSCVVSWVPTLDYGSIIGSVAYVLRIVTPDGAVFDYTVIDSQKSGVIGPISTPTLSLLTSSSSVITANLPPGGPQLVLESYSWPSGGPLSGVLSNNGTAPIEIGTTDSVDSVPANAIGTGAGCYGITLMPQQSCAFSMDAVNAAITGTQTFSWTYSLNPRLNSPYQLRVVLAGGGQMQFDVTYGGSSNQPQLGLYIPSGAQTVIAIGSGIANQPIVYTSSSQSANPIVFSQDFFVKNAFFMIGAIAGGVLLIGAILGIVGISAATRNEGKGLYGEEENRGRDNRRYIPLLAALGLGAVGLVTVSILTPALNLKFELLASRIQYLIVGVLVLILTGSVLGLVSTVKAVVRGRRKNLRKVGAEENEMVSAEVPHSVEEPIQPQRTMKTCHHCGAEMKPSDSICGKCGKPAMYRK